MSVYYLSLADHETTKLFNYLLVSFSYLCVSAARVSVCYLCVFLCYLCVSVDLSQETLGDIIRPLLDEKAKVTNENISADLVHAQVLDRPTLAHI